MQAPSVSIVVRLLTARRGEFLNEHDADFCARREKRTLVKGRKRGEDR
jgi:hypothetical protein